MEDGMTKVGDRVGAVYTGDKETLQIFGFGVYEGDFTPKEAAGWIAETAREIGTKNPRIKLDSGKVVYGCECWWGSEEAVKAQVAKYPKVIEVDIDEVRERCRREEAAEAAKQG
jgi:hypothetical protein